MKKVKSLYRKHHRFILVSVVALALFLIGIIILYRRNQFTKWLIEDTGSVADWIGNVSIPTILAWFTLRYRTQEKQKNLQNEKDKVFGLILDSSRIYSHLEFALAKQNLPTFQQELNKYIEDLRRMREKTLYFNDHSTSKPLYSKFGDLIDDSKNINNFNQADDYMKTLQAVDDALRKYYKQIN